MRYQILIRVKQLLIIDDLIINEQNHIDNPCLPDLDLRLTYLPLYRYNQDLLHQLASYQFQVISYCL